MEYYIKSTIRQICQSPDDSNPPADGSRTGREPVLKRITERIAVSAQPLLAEFQRQKPTLGIIDGENANANVPNPVEPEQLPVSMPQNHARIIP